MKSTMPSVFVIGVLAFLIGAQASASITLPAQPWAPVTGNAAEKNLNDILDTLYGATNWVQLSDQTSFWNPDGKAKATAKYAADSQSIDYIGSISGTTFLFNTAPSILVPLPSVGGEAFTLRDTTSYPYVWSSDPSLNGGDVHVLKYKITNLIDTYVFAYEDRALISSDLDYQDMVLEVQGVVAIPEPTTIIVWSLLGASCAGLAVVRRRRNGSPQP
jgi:hypothetical protein